MAKRIDNPTDVIGKTFNYLTPVKYLGRDKFHHLVYLCKCKCGSEINLARNIFISGKQKSCGCYSNFNNIKYENCKMCGSKIAEHKYRAYCSNKCMEKSYSENGMYNCQCVVCGKNFHLKESRVRKIKSGITCSRKCSSEHRRNIMKGENNHQYGLRGSKNSSFIGNKTLIDGYVMVYVGLSYHGANSSGRIREHRYVINENAELFDAKYFDIVDGKKYLKDEYDVHHINHITFDNRLSNLAILTRGEHSRLHNAKKQIIRSEIGKIKGYVYKEDVMDVKLKLFGGKVPEFKTDQAACADCFANEKVCIKPGNRTLVKLGIGLELGLGYEAVIRPRSGMSKSGIDVAIGTIDADYRGEIKANVINNSTEDFNIDIGDRICQIAIRKTEDVKFVEVDELSVTERGDGGFGHTGK